MCEEGLAKSGPKGERSKWEEAVQGWGEEKLAKAWYIGRHNSVAQALGRKKEGTNNPFTDFKGFKPYPKTSGIALKND